MMYTLSELRKALDHVNEILTDLEQQELNLSNDRSKATLGEILQGKEEFEKLYIECMERLCAGKSSPNDEEHTFAKLQELKPEEYSVEDFLYMLVSLENIKNSCIYLIWYRRLILDKQPLVIRMNWLEGTEFVYNFFCGEWITPEEKMTEEFMGRFEMLLDVVHFGILDKHTFDILNGYEKRILEFNSFKMLVKGIRSGLLCEEKSDIYIDYYLNKGQTELVPYLMSDKLWRW